MLTPQRHVYLPSRVHGQNAFLGQPGKEHPDRGHMLLNSCRRARMLFDVRRHRDRLNILQAAKARALAPIQKLTDRMIVSDPGVLVADGNGKKFEVSLGRFRADVGDKRWNLEGFGFNECRSVLKS